MSQADLYASGPDGRPRAITCTEDKKLYVVLCGTQLDGTVTPLLCDADGKLVVTS
jgi:hypothetical protein